MLCGLRPEVQRVFDIAGLTRQFRIMASCAEGAAALSPRIADANHRDSERVIAEAKILL